jgi:glycosyltransferase involved in cell wall biosynthesis
LGVLRFSVVVPCFNQGTFLQECLDSIRAQRRPVDQVVVVNDGSTDPHTLERLAALADEGIVVVHQPNGGAASARNAGVRHATGDWIVTLDADDRLTADAIEQFEGAIARAPEVDVWVPDLAHFGLRSDVFPVPEFNAWRQLWQNQLNCCAAIRRAVFDAGVTYNEKLRNDYEDWEFWIHACCERGFVARPLGKPVFLYRKWGFSMLSSAETRHARVVARIRAERPIFADDEALLALKR